MNWTTLNNRAFTPYSKNPRACIVQGKSGKFYAGVRIESLSFPLTIPAIQAACCYCLAEGDQPIKVIAESRNLEQLDFWLKEFDMELEIAQNIDQIDCIEETVHVEQKEALPTLKILLDSAVTTNSNFPVSALLYIDDKHNAVTGVNVEVSDWTKGLCAERVAIGKAFAFGYKNLSSMAVHTRKGEVSSPCGACRQVLAEHLGAHKIDLYHADSTMSRHRISDLLPFSFKSSALN